MTGTIFDVEVIASSGNAALTFVDGATIHERGEEGRFAYIVKRGSVELRQKGRPVETIGPGEIFGEAAAIAGTPHLVTAVAVGDLELLPIDHDMFAVLVRDDEDFAQTVIRLLARRLHATSEMFERCVEDLPAEDGAAASARAGA